MPNFEPASYCPMQEYLAWEPTRLQANELVIDDLYMTFFSLRTQVSARQAIKIPTRVLHVEEGESKDIHVVTFAAPADDTKTELTRVAGIYKDGLWIEPSAPETRLMVDQVEVMANYFRGFDGSVGSPLEQLGLAAEILAEEVFETPRELVLS